MATLNAAVTDTNTPSMALANDGYILTPWIAQCIDMPLIPQRSDAWFELRKARITGSVVDTILGNNPYGDYDQLVCEKAGMPVAFKGNDATAHGTLYEPMAIEQYCCRTGRHVVELGLTPHRACSTLAHSPDGISLSKASDPVLLEIKCPLRRTIKPGQVPAYYVAQLQMGMDLFDLKAAHFVQFKPDPHVLDITVVPREEGWLARHMPALERFWADVQRWQATGWQEHPKYMVKGGTEYLKSVCVL